MLGAQQAIAQVKVANVSANGSDARHSDEPHRAEYRESARKGFRSKSRAPSLGFLDGETLFGCQGTAQESTRRTFVEIEQGNNGRAD